VSAEALQLADDLELCGQPSRLCQRAANELRRLAPLVGTFSVIKEGDRFRVIGPRLGSGWTFERWEDAERCRSGLEKQEEVKGPCAYPYLCNDTCRAPQLCNRER